MSHQSQLELRALRKTIADLQERNAELQRQNQRLVEQIARMKSAPPLRNPALSITDCYYGTEGF